MTISCTARPNDHDLLGHRLLLPRQSKRRSQASSLNRQSTIRDPDHRAEALGLGVQLPVPQQAADEMRRFVLPDRETDQAISGVTVPKVQATKMRVPRNVGWPWQILGSRTM